MYGLEPEAAQANRGQRAAEVLEGKRRTENTSSKNVTAGVGWVFERVNESLNRCGEADERLTADGGGTGERI